MSERALSTALECLKAVRHRLVVVGGTAHRLFPLHAAGRDPGFELLTTEDVDLAVPLELGHDGSRELLDRLERAGFTEEVRGADEPAYTYRLPEDQPAYLQFIAPLTGSGTRRDGRPDRLLRFSGIHAEKLRHVDLLLHEPWTASVGNAEAATPLRVVNPVTFLVQKLLLLTDRGTKRAKDLLYVFDTLSIFADGLDELGSSTIYAPQLSKADVKRIRRTAGELCFAETDVSRNSAAIRRGPTHPRARLRPDRRRLPPRAAPHPGSGRPRSVKSRFHRRLQDPSPPPARSPSARVNDSEGVSAVGCAHGVLRSWS